MLFASYRADQFSDAEGYAESLVLVLSQYPPDVIIFVTNPTTGIQRKCKWPPTIAEIVAACDERVSDINREKRYRNWGQNEPLALEGPQEPKLTIAELKAKYGPTWGIDQTDGAVARQSAPVPTWDEITKAYQSDPSRIKALAETEFMNRKSSKA